MTPYMMEVMLKLSSHSCSNLQLKMKSVDNPAKQTCGTHVVRVRYITRSGDHLDEQWCEPFAAQLLVHTQEVDFHHAFGIASYAYCCWHRCMHNRWFRHTKEHTKSSDYNRN